MSKLKLMSVLQSRIAKRRILLASGWELFYELDSENDLEIWKTNLLSVGITQKEDKQILKQLVMDEMEIKKWKKEFERSLETNRSLEVQIRHVKATGHPLIRGMAN